MDRRGVGRGGWPGLGARRVTGAGRQCCRRCGGSRQRLGAAAAWCLVRRASAACVIARGLVRSAGGAGRRRPCCCPAVRCFPVVPVLGRRWLWFLSLFKVRPRPMHQSYLHTRPPPAHPGLALVVRRVGLPSRRIVSTGGPGRPRGTTSTLVRAARGGGLTRPAVARRPRWGESAVGRPSPRPPCRTSSARPPIAKLGPRPGGATDKAPGGGGA